MALQPFVAMTGGAAAAWGNLRPGFALDDQTIAARSGITVSRLDP